MLTTEGVVSFTRGASVGIWPPVISGTWASPGEFAITTQRNNAPTNRRFIFADKLLVMVSE
jgi:hypothetical protein